SPRPPRHPPSFPTRRSSDLAATADVDHPPDSFPRDSQQGGGVLDLRLDLLDGAGSRQVDGPVPVEQQLGVAPKRRAHILTIWSRSEEHTSELQSRGHLVCCL